LFLTLIGGGAFGNPRDSIHDAIINAHKKYGQKKTGLEEVTLVIFAPDGDPKLLKRLEGEKIPYQRIHFDDDNNKQVTSWPPQTPSVPTRRAPAPPNSSDLPPHEKPSGSDSHQASPQVVPGLTSHQEQKGHQKGPEITPILPEQVALGSIKKTEGQKGTPIIGGAHSPPNQLGHTNAEKGA